MIELKYNTNLKTYNTKINLNACEITFLLSSAVCTLCLLFSKQRFIGKFSISNNCWKTGNMTTRTEIVYPCIQVSENSTNFAEKWKFYQKSTTHQSWKVSNDTFLPKPSMTNSVYRKLLNLEVFHISCTLYLY